MTPPPAAAAARPGLAPRRSGTPRPQSRPPRRVSGPARSAVGRAAIAVPRPLPAGPPVRARANPGLLRSAAAVLGSHLGRPLLDRLLRGRLWIAIVSFALIGIVAMQLYDLKLNSGIGRAIEHQALLQRQNAALSIADSSLASGTRVESQAGAMGMQATAPGAVQFLSLRRAQDLRGAVQALRSARPAASTGAAASETYAAEAPALEAPVSTSTETEASPGGTEAAVSEQTATTETLEAGTSPETGTAYAETGTAYGETSMAGETGVSTETAGEEPASAASTGGVQG